jgi:branched-chain amino acid transport system substrate-binding protein
LKAKFIAVTCLALTAVASCTREEPVIKVGVLASLTGNYSSYGRRAWEGMKLAFEEINAAGGVNGKKLMPLIEDDMSTAEKGQAPVGKFIDVDKAAVIVAMVPGTTLAQIAQLAEKGRTPMLSSYAVSADFPATGSYSFQAQSSRTVDAVLLARLASDRLKARRFAILYLDDPVGRACGEAFKRAALVRSGSIEFIDLFQAARKDFKAYLDSIKQHEPDVIYFVGNGEDTGTFLAQARARGLEQPVLVSSLAGPELVERAKKAAEGVVMLSQDMTSAGRAELPVSHRDAKYRSLDTFAAEGYDVAHLLARALASGGPGAEGARAGLETVKSFEGMHGVIKLLCASQPRIELTPMTVKGGKFTSLQ